MNIEFYTLIHKLYFSVVNNLMSLSEHHDENALEKTAADCIAFEKAFVSNRLMSANLAAPFKRINDIFSGDPSAHVKELADILVGMSEDITVNIVTRIENEIEGTPFLDKALTDILFDYFELIGLERTETQQLAFKVCERASYTNPMRSYEFSLKVLTANPKLLNGPKMPHPEYVYSYTEQRTFDRCLICGGNGVPYYRSFPYITPNGTLPHLPVKLWMRCEDCGNYYAYQFPEEYLALCENMELLMPDSSKYITSTKEVYGNILATWCNKLKSLSSYTDGSNLLEVGIGNGELLAVALELGYDTDAVEITPGQAQYVSNMLNIPIWNCDFLRFTSDKKYSIIIMGDVIEHVTDPEKALRKAYELLADDGVLWISTPNFKSSYSLLRKFKDVMWSIANHITYFSYDGMKALAEKCGFKVADYKVSDHYNGSMELTLVKS